MLTNNLTTRRLVWTCRKQVDRRDNGEQPTNDISLKLGWLSYAMPPVGVGILFSAELCNLPKAETDGRLRGTVQRLLFCPRQLTNRP